MELSKQQITDLRNELQAVLDKYEQDAEITVNDGWCHPDTGHTPLRFEFDGLIEGNWSEEEEVCEYDR
jgi:hypothetical protein